MTEDNGSLGFFAARQGSAPFDKLVELQVRCNENRLDRQIPIRISLEIGKWPLMVEKTSWPTKFKAKFASKENLTSPTSVNLTVRLHHCYVHYESYGINVISDSKYSLPLQHGKISILATEKMTSENKGGAGFRAKLSGGLTTGAAADINVSGQLSSTGEKKNEEVRKGQRKIYEISCVAKGWRIGDEELGGIYTASGCLDGTYFQDEENKPTCILEFDRNILSGRIKFTVNAFDSFRVERSGGAIAPQGERDAATELMKNKIAAIAFENHVLKRTESRTDIYGFLHLTTVVCDVARDGDGESVPPTKTRDERNLTLESPLKNAKKIPKRAKR